MAEEKAGDQEGGPGFRASKLGIAITIHDRAHLVHQRWVSSAPGSRMEKKSIRPMKNG